MRSGFPLYACAINNTPVDAIQETILRLGKFPSSWSHVQFNQEGYLERDGCEDPVDLFVELPSCSLHQQVNLIEDKQFILPEINIRLQGSKPPGEIRNKSCTKPLSLSKPAGEVRNKAFSKMHRSCTKPLSFARTAGIYLIECSSTRLLVQAPIKKEMAPFPKISETESSDLTDLLSKILTWQPEDRLSLIDIKKHPWLTASVDSTHETPFAEGSITHV